MGRVRLGWLAIATLALSGCGGGNTVGPDPPPPPPPPACGYTLQLSKSTLLISGEQGTATVAPNPGSSSCQWTLAGETWLTLSATSGSGQQNVIYTAGPNNTGSQLNGSIRLSWSGGSTQQAVSQAGASVPIQLDVQTQQVSGAGGNGLVLKVTTSATWTARTDQPSWITITSGGVNVAGGARTQSVTGNGQVVYNVSENAGAARDGHLIIEGGGSSQSLTISQAAKAGCSIALGSHSLTANVAGTSGSVSVTAGCAWTAASNAPWLRITSGTSGSGNGTINYTVDSNANNAARSGTITVSGTGTSDAVNVDQPSGVVEAKFTFTKTSSGSGDACEVLENSTTDQNARFIVKCNFNASSSVNAVFIASYKFTLDSANPVITLGTTSLVTEPKTGCGFPDANTRTPLPVTLTVVTNSGATKTQTQQVPFIKPKPC